jgi:hypothetical protein
MYYYIIAKVLVLSEKALLVTYKVNPYQLNYTIRNSLVLGAIILAILSEGLIRSLVI